MRSLIVLPILGAIAFVWPGWRMLRVERGKWVAFRSVLLVVNWLVYYTALPLMPLPLVVATLYTAPIFTTLFAAVLLGDPIGRAGWAGVLLGFAGVLLVIQPGSDGVGWVALLPVAAAVLYALNAIVTRAKCREEHPMVLAL
ncbi:MAG: DMT family transporter [Pseudomonadota bacterium]